MFEHFCGNRDSIVVNGDVDAEGNRGVFQRGARTDFQDSFDSLCTKLSHNPKGNRQEVIVFQMHHFTVSPVAGAACENFDRRRVTLSRIVQNSSIENVRTPELERELIHIKKRNIKIREKAQPYS